MSNLLLVLLAQASAESSNAFGAISLPIVVVVGFVAAVSLGSIAWFNSKRPAGWEDKERPDLVPKVEKSETPGVGNPEP
jgi:hypothetical protein